MLNSLKKPSKSPLRDALVGVLGAIPLAYFLLFAGDIAAGNHQLNFEMLASFVWLGVGVLLFAWYEAFKRSRA